jgi:hypothetical protein
MSDFPGEIEFRLLVLDRDPVKERAKISESE